MDPRKRRALNLQETSDNASSVATPRTRVPGKASKVPPNLAPLESVLPEDMRLAHTSTTLELMQAHVSATDTQRGDTRLRRDVRRWRDEAGAVRDALLLREEAERSAKMAMVNRMGSISLGGVEDDGTSVTNSGATSDGPSPSRAFFFGDERALSRSRSVQWVEAYRPEQGAAIATAKAREARKAALALAREAAKKKAEEKAARKAADPRSSFRKALDLTRRALGLESAYAAMYASELARRERAEKEKAAAANAKRRDAALDANVLLFDELTAGSGSSEREATLRARFRERVADAGEVLADLPLRADSRLDRASGSRSRSTTPCLCVIERGCVEIRVALGDECRDEKKSERVDRKKDDGDVSPRARLGFGPSRLVATLSRGHMFAVDGAALASLFGCPARATFAVVVRDSAAESEAKEKSDEKCVLWELRDRAAFAAMAPSLLRRRAAFAALWASVPALGAFSEPARAFFMDAARRVTRRPGAHFCVEREPCDAVGVVETGRAIAHRRARDDEDEKDAPPPPTTTTEEPRGETHSVRPSRRVILGEYARGDFFGARALRDDAGAPTPALYAATTTARDVTSALVVTRAAFLRMTRGAPGGFGSGTDCSSTRTLSTQSASSFFSDRIDLDLATNDERRTTPDESRDKSEADAFASDAFAVPGVSGAAAAEERAWLCSANRAPPEHSAVARLLLDALLLTPPFVAVGRSVVANAEAATRRMRPRRVRVGETLFRRGDACVAAFIVQTGALRLVGDDHGGELADEHVEIPEDDEDENEKDERGQRRPRPFGDAGAGVRLAETRVSAGSAAGSAVASSTKNQTRAAPGSGSGLRVVAELGPGDACGFAALPHPGCGATWQCSALAAASPSPGAWVTVWELGLKDFHQTAGYALDDKRDRFASLLAPATCPALAGLSDRQRLRALDALDHATYEHGESITTRGAPSNEGVFVVMRGVANEETGGASAYAAFPASGVDGFSSAVVRGCEKRDSRVRRLSGNAGGATSATPTTSRELRRGDVFGTDGVFDVFGTREKSVTAGGGVGARVSCAVWRPAALAQLGFLRRALEEFQRRRA